MVFKKLKEGDVQENREVEVLNKLFGDSAIIKKDAGWTYTKNSDFTNDPSLVSNVYFVGDNFYVTFGSEDNSNYNEWLPWNAIMSSIQAPWDAENKRYDFYVQGQRITEFIAFSVNPDRYNDKIDFDNFAIVMKGETDDTFTDLDGSGNPTSHVALAPYFVKSSVQDTLYDSSNEEIKHSNRITPAYDVRYTDDLTFLTYNSASESIDIDWSIGTVSEQVGVFYPTLGLMLVFPELLTDHPTLKDTIDGASNKALVSLQSTMMVMGYGVTKKTRTVVFSRLLNNEFNRTTNPTAFTLIGGEPELEEYIEREKITFPTKIGYYNDQNELLAVANFSQPYKKSPEEELTIISTIEE